MSEQLEEVLTLTRENNKLIKAMRRDALIGGIIQFVFWAVVILGSLYVTVKFVEPYMTTFMQAAGGGEGIGPQNWGALLEEYQSLLGQ